MKSSFAIAVFSSRRAQLEDARATALEVIEKQLVTDEMAAGFRLIDFLAEGFAEYERRFRALPFEDKFYALCQKAHGTPEEYGEAMAPAFLDVLKEIAGKRRCSAFDDILSIPWELPG